MNGNRYLLDTNAIAAVLQGNKPLLRRLSNADWIGISVISQIEILAFAGLTDADRDLFEQFKQRVTVVGLDAKDEESIRLIVRLRQQYHLKIPDAIIAATAIKEMASLLTGDSQLKSVPDVHAVDINKN